MMLEFENISTRVKDFVERYVDSFIAWDLVLFFRENPYTVGSADSLALSIGRRESDLRPHLERLADRGILKRDIPAGTEMDPLYTYIPVPEFESCLDEFKQALKDRSTRLIIVSLVLQKETGR